MSPFGLDAQGKEVSELRVLAQSLDPLITDLDDTEDGYVDVKQVLVARKDSIRIIPS